MARFHFRLVGLDCPSCGRPVAKPKNPHRIFSSDETVTIENLKPTKRTYLPEFRPAGLVICSDCYAKTVTQKIMGEFKEHQGRMRLRSMIQRVISRVRGI